MFSTAWRDFTNDPHTKLVSLTSQQLDAAAADLMLNSTAAWNATYDDSTRARGVQAPLSMWPAFTAFVREHHFDAASAVPWDPLSIELERLSLGGDANDE